MDGKTHLGIFTKACSATGTYAMQLLSYILYDISNVSIRCFDCVYGGGVTIFRLRWIGCPLTTKITSKNGEGIKSCEYFLDAINFWQPCSVAAGRETRTPDQLHFPTLSSFHPWIDNCI